MHGRLSLAAVLGALALPLSQLATGADAVRLAPASGTGGGAQYLNSGLVTTGADGRMTVANADGTESAIDVDYDQSLGDLPDRDRSMPIDTLAGTHAEADSSAIRVRETLAGSSLKVADVAQSIAGATAPGSGVAAAHAAALADEGYVPDDLKDPHAMPAPTTTQAEQDTANAGPVTRTVDDGIDTGGADGDEEHKVTDANVVAGREWRRPLGSDPGGIDPDDMNDKMRAVDNAAPSQDDPVTPMGTGFSIGDVSANLARMYPKKTERVVASDPARLSQPPIQLARDHAETLTDDIATEVKGEDTEVLGEPVRGWGQITQGLHDARGTRVLDRSIINAARGARGRDGGDALHLPNADGAVNDLASSRGGFTGAQERDNLEKMPLRLERTPGQLSQTPFREGMEEDILGAK